MRLIGIKPSQNDFSFQLSEIARDVMQANQENYRKNGYEEPWCAYFAIENGRLVGTCAFKTPPKNQQVEIAYFTFPGNEGRGVATRMVQELLKIAQAGNPSMKITAQTLPQINASTPVLSNLGFTKTGSTLHSEDGEVWEWSRETNIDADAG